MRLAQCDLWFPPVDVALGFGQVGRPPVLVMVSGYSRWLSAVMIPSRQSPDLLAGHWTLISGWGRTPKALVWDNESAVGQWRAGRPQLTEAMNAFRGTLGIKVIQCRPADPEAKGLVERANGYLETSFLPGRRFGSPEDFNAPSGWCGRTTANTGRWAAARCSGGTPIGPRCCRCLRWRRWSAGDRPRGCPEITTCVWTATTIRCIPRSSGVVSISPLTPIVDEVGYIPFEAEAANLFFQLVSSRYERASLIVTSNKPFGRWGEVFGADIVAAAMIDRLVHHAEVISLKGYSYRLKDRDLGRVPAATKTNN